MSDIAGRKLLRATLKIPPAGGWWADVTLSDGAALALGRATLTIGDLALVGTVTTTGIDAPDQPRAIVEGGAGWSAPLPREGRYTGGVRLSTVLRDLADLARTDPASAATAEPYDAPAEVILGDAYEWPASTSTAPVRASAVLAELRLRGAISTWRVNPATGRTRFDAWPSIGAADRFGRLIDPRNLGRGVRRYALDTQVAAWVPGATAEGVRIARVTIREDAGKVEAEVWDS